MYNYHDSQAHGYERSVILSRLDDFWEWDGFGYGVVGMIFGVVCVEPCDP
jgi:hypothetical protein